VHSLRVTALTTARERGSDIIDLQDFAGHADPRTTLTYTLSMTTEVLSPYERPSSVRRTGSSRLEPAALATAMPHAAQSRAREK
jgi:integrase